VIVGLVDCKRHEPRPTADSLDRPRCCSGIRPAQVDEHCTRLGIGDSCDAARAQIGDVDHDKVSAAAQCCGQVIPDQMNGAGDDQPNDLRDSRIRSPECPFTGVSRHLRPPLGRITPSEDILFVGL
jgi:hypothetical protein